MATSIKSRREILSLMGLPNAIQVSIDLEVGAAYFHMPGIVATKGGVSYTIPDLGPNKSGINIDIGQDGRIYGLEDISGPLSTVIANWFHALKDVKRRLELKAQDPEKFRKRFGHKSHFAKRFDLDGKKDYGVGALCGEPNSYTLVENEEKWNEKLTKGTACLRCQKLRS